MEFRDGNATDCAVGQSQNSSDIPEPFQTGANGVPECRNVVAAVDELSPGHSLFAFLVAGLFTSLLSVFGTFGNIKSATLLRNSQLFAGGQFVTETFTALTVWDTILLLSNSGYYSLFIMWKFLSGSMPLALLYSTIVFNPVCAASFNASALLVSVLATQRMFVVRNPLTPRRLSIRKSFFHDITPRSAG